MRKIIRISIPLLFLLLWNSLLQAQCAMCGATAETSTASGVKSTIGLNQGILLMVSAPYLVVIGVAVAWWYNVRKKKQQALKEQ